MAIEPKLQALESALWLANQKTQKKIVIFYYPAAKDFISEYYPLAKGDERHRVGEYWVRSEQAAYTADRAYRLFIKLYSREAIKNKPLTVVEFSRYCKLYFNSYPNDDMSANRLHFFIQAIREGTIVEMNKCSCCTEPYVVHRFDCQLTVCGVCRRRDAIKAASNPLPKQDMPMLVPMQPQQSSIVEATV